MARLTDIESLRKKLGLTREEFATKLEVSYLTVARWETSRHKPSKMALKLMRQLEDEANKLNSNNDANG